LTDEIPDLATLIDCADKAMYQSKHKGRNLVTEYTSVTE